MKISWYHWYGFRIRKNSHIKKIISKRRKNQMEKMIKFFKEEDGVTAIEYGLIAALISVAIIAILGTMSTSLQTIFQTISTALSGAAG